MKKIILWVSVIVVVLVIAAGAAVFFSLNSIVKKGVETYGPQMTKVDVRLDSADLSPFSGSGKLSGLFVGNPQPYKAPSAIQLGSVKIAVKIGSVFSDTVVVDEINIQAPEITLEGDLSGNNLSKILDNLNGASATQEKQKNAPPPPGEKKAKKFIVKDFVLNGTKLNVNVNGLGKNLTTTLTIPDLHLQNIGNSEGGVSSAELARQVLQPILASAVSTAEDALKKKGVEGVTKAVGGALTNLFK